VRPQTIVEIKRMRRAAARIAQMIQTEVIIMEKRKVYVEQMTSYLNDRIRELNKVRDPVSVRIVWFSATDLSAHHRSRWSWIRKIDGSS